MEILRRALAQGIRAEPYPYLSVGRKVRITAGALTGLEAIVIRLKGKQRVVISTELIQRSILLDVDVMDVAPIKTHSTASQR